jgi:hypothetical protein
MQTQEQHNILLMEKAKEIFEPLKERYFSLVNKKHKCKKLWILPWSRIETTKETLIIKYVINYPDIQVNVVFEKGGYYGWDAEWSDNEYLNIIPSFFSSNDLNHLEDSHNVQKFIARLADAGEKYRII